MLAIYVLSLGISAGLAGVFLQRAICGQSLIATTFHMDLMLTSGIACAYAALQLAYIALVQLLYPTRSRTHLFAETLSNLAAIVLIPYIAHVQVDWPHQMLADAEPLIYLGLFCVIHGFFKLLSFFAAIDGLPTNRLRAAAWATACLTAALGAYFLTGSWLASARQNLPKGDEDAKPYHIAGVSALARGIPEAAEFTCPLPEAGGQNLVLRWANSPEPDKADEALETIYVTAVFEGVTTKPYSSQLNLSDQAWTEFRLPAQTIPSGARACTIQWSTQKAPAWRFLSGLRPLVASQQRLLVSGPFYHERKEDSSPPSIVVVAVEGLGTEFLSSMGYPEETTPFLDRLAFTSVAFPNAYTPSPEAPAACMTLLTGYCPLHHGYLAGRQGPLPEACRPLSELLAEQHYSTIAFTEGQDEEPGLVFGSGFERGFEVFDATYSAEARKSDANTPSPPPDSRVTLQAATAWMDQHAAEQFFVFIRLRELARPTALERYNIPRKPEPAQRDLYKAALRYVDEQLGSLVKYTHEREAGKNLCLVIAGAYGHDFSAGPKNPPQRLLSEATLRVPVFISLPDARKESRNGPIAIEDIAPTLLSVLGITPASPCDGRPVLSVPSTKEPVSLMGKPLILTTRANQWRFTWASGQLPFMPRVRLEGQVIELYDVSQPQKRNAAPRYPDLVTRYRDYLVNYLERHCQSAAP